jgi:hypothetical protein
VGFPDVSEANIDESSIVQSFLEQEKQGRSPPALDAASNSAFFTEVGHSEVFALLSARRDEALDDSAIESAKRRIVEQEVQRFRSRLKVKAGLSPGGLCCCHSCRERCFTTFLLAIVVSDSTNPESPQALEVSVAEAAVAFVAQPLVFESVISESKLSEDNSYTSDFSAYNDFDASQEGGDMITEGISLKVIVGTVSIVPLSRLC